MDARNKARPRQMERPASERKGGGETSRHCRARCEARGEATGIRWSSREATAGECDKRFDVKCGKVGRANANRPAVDCE